MRQLFFSFENKKHLFFICFQSQNLQHDVNLNTHQHIIHYKFSYSFIDTNWACLHIANCNYFLEGKRRINWFASKTVQLSSSKFLIMVINIILSNRSAFISNNDQRSDVFYISRLKKAIERNTSIRFTSNIRMVLLIRKLSFLHIFVRKDVS